MTRSPFHKTTGVSRAFYRSGSWHPHHHSPHQRKRQPTEETEASAAGSISSRGRRQGRRWLTDSTGSDGLTDCTGLAASSPRECPGRKGASRLRGLGLLAGKRFSQPARDASVTHVRVVVALQVCGVACREVSEFLHFLLSVELVGVRRLSTGERKLPWWRHLCLLYYVIAASL